MQGTITVNRVIASLIDIKMDITIRVKITKVSIIVTKIITNITITMVTKEVKEAQVAIEYQGTTETVDQLIKDQTLIKVEIRESLTISTKDEVETLRATTLEGIKKESLVMRGFLFAISLHQESRKARLNQV